MINHNSRNVIFKLPFLRLVLLTTKTKVDRKYSFLRPEGNHIKFTLFGLPPKDNAMTCKILFAKKVEKKET